MGFWGPAPVPFSHIGTYGHAFDYLHPRWVLRDCPGPLRSYWDIWTCIRVPSPRMGFEGLARPPSVIMGHMDMHLSTFTQDGFWGPAPVPFSHIGTYGHALEYLHPGWVLRDSPGPLPSYLDIWTCTWVHSPRMGFWGPAPAPFGHIGTYGPALEYLQPGWVLRDCPGFLPSYWDIWTCTRVPSPRMGFEGLPRPSSVILGHMDMHSSAFTQDGFWGTAPLPFGNNRTYGPALEYLHPGWVLRDCLGPLRS